jgi:tetratricopeptide (TPR) repeat protein
MELKLYPKAVVTLQQALRINPDDVDALRTLGSSYFFLEDWAHAISMWEHFIQLKPQQALGYFFTAVSYDKMGNVPQALLNYNKFIEFDDGSDDPRSFQVRQRAKALGRRPDQVAKE